MLYHKMYFLVKFLDLIVSFTSEWLFFKSKYSKTKKKNSTKDENTQLFLSYFLLNNNNPPPPKKPHPSNNLNLQSFGNTCVLI